MEDTGGKKKKKEKKAGGEKGEQKAQGELGELKNAQGELGEQEKAEGEQPEQDKPRWIDLFERESHRPHQMEYLRDKEYEDIITTLRRSSRLNEKTGAEAEDEDTNSHSKSLTPFHIQIPPEQYFLSPDPTMHHYYGGLLSGSRSSGTFSTSQSESSFGESTATVSFQPSSKRWLPPEEKRSRRRRTALYVCFGLLAIALISMVVGVILHFLLKTGTIGGGGRERPDQKDALTE